VIISLNNKKDISIDEAFERFINECKVKNLRPHSITFYKASWKRFRIFANEISIYELNKKIINDYILELKNNDTKPITINTKLRGLSAIMYYFMEEFYIDKFRFPTIKYDEPIKDTYTEEELKTLLNKPNVKKCDFSEYRAWATVNFLLATGTRVGTVINIKIKDLDFENDLINLTYTKNRKQQVVPMCITLKKVLLEYISYRRGESEDYLFCNVYGKQISSRAFQGSIANYNHKRGIFKTSCHMFRHTFSKMWVQNDGNMFKLQKLLGHSSLEMVKKYVNLYGNDLKIGYNEANPLEKINKLNSSESINMSRNHTNMKNK
jgi:integrase/recombinase XerD